MAWVVGGRPETEEFLGVRVLPGTEMALRGSVTKEGDDPWTSGTVGCGKSTLTGTFQIAGTTARGVRYGYQWFQRMVRWPCDCECESSTITLWLWCDEDVPDAGRRHLREARVVEWEIDDTNPNLGACYGMNVNVTWEIEDPRMWLDAELLVDTSETPWTIDLADAAHTDGCTPLTVCPDDPDDMTYVEWEEERPTRPITLRSDGTWCPIGNWLPTELQVFGGEAIAVVDSFVETETPCIGCGEYGIRLIYDTRTGNPVGGEGWAFETVRWTNHSWTLQRAAIPCGCPIRVIETVHLYETPNSTEGQPAVQHKDVATYSGEPSPGEDCCPVDLLWLSDRHGYFTTGALSRPGGASWHPSDVSPTYVDYRLSGFPPVGCTLIVNRPECVEASNFPFSACAVGARPVSLGLNGRWDPVGWGRDAADEWPPPGTEVVVSGQVDTPVRRGSWQPKDVVGCLPGGPDSATLLPLVDPGDTLADLVEWCNPLVQSVWVTPILASECERQLTTIVTVAAGAGGSLRWLRWAIWPRVADYGDMATPDSRAQYRAVEPVALGEVPIIGAGQTVTFDGQRSVIALNCEGRDVPSELAGFGPAGLHEHPVLPPGQDYLFAVLAHPWTTPETAWYRVETVTWELP
jgi:hypothetical protein